ncbi:Abi family protein [Vibrio harveyi]|uniref:Abi family protein n=1 Tax=Vibrio harveyi TaxID=669 RepID=UPI0018F2697F|nr:Abi family protein [Vibrio harveyi]
MPFNYDYDEPRRLITQSRLSSYSTSIATENDAQLFGAYSWNLAVVGAFYPLLQIIEVSLRNAISNAAKLKAEQAGVNGFWFDNLLYWQDSNEQGQPLTAEQVKKFKKKINAAKGAAKKALEDKGEVDPIPNLDQIIAQTDFSTWEYIFDKHYYNGSDNNYIWPTGLTKAFKKLPRTTESNAMFHQRDIIRRRIEEVRSFRNRVSHNEPAWRLSDVEKKEDIITLLTAKLDNMMELLFWISPKFQRYVTDIGIEARIRQVLNLTELDRYMHAYETLEISDIEALLGLTQKVNETNVRSHFNVGGENGILMPHNTQLIQ